MAIPSFHGLRVLALESRRTTEVATLISTYGGQPLVAPALREVPVTSNTDALECAAALLRGEVDIVIFLTGVGTRALVRVIEGTYPAIPSSPRSRAPRSWRAARNRSRCYASYRCRSGWPHPSRTRGARCSLLSTRRRRNSRSPARTSKSSSPERASGKLNSRLPALCRIRGVGPAPSISVALRTARRGI